jgi:hypothetical protein
MQRTLRADTIGQGVGLGDLHRDRVDVGGNDRVRRRLGRGDRQNGGARADIRDALGQHALTQQAVERLRQPFVVP